MQTFIQSKLKVGLLALAVCGLMAFAPTPASADPHNFGRVAVGLILNTLPGTSYGNGNGYPNSGYNNGYGYPDNDYNNGYSNGYYGNSGYNNGYNGYPSNNGYNGYPSSTLYIGYNNGYNGYNTGYNGYTNGYYSNGTYRHHRH